MSSLLLLDPNPETAHTLNMVLEQRGVRLLGCTTLEEGVRVLRESKNLPDAIFCSVNSPRLDGMRFLRGVRSQAVWASIPVIVTSEQADFQQRDNAIEAGADAFLVKPFRYEELNRVLMNLGVFNVAVA